MASTIRLNGLIWIRCASAQTGTPGWSDASYDPSNLKDTFTLAR
jgi:hypothetical protein